MAATPVPAILATVEMESPALLKLVTWGGLYSVHSIACMVVTLCHTHVHCRLPCQHSTESSGIMKGISQPLRYR